MTTRRRIQSIQTAKSYTDRNKRKLIPALLGNNAGTVEVVSGQLEWVWIRLHQDPNQVARAYMATAVEPTADIMVEVEWVDPIGYVIRGIATSPVYINNPWTGSVPAHAWQHERGDFSQGGFDPVNTHIRAIHELRARQTVPASLSLYVEYGRYPMGGVEYIMPATTTSALTPPSNPGEQRIDLLYIDAAQTLQWVTGTPVVAGGFIVPSRPGNPTGGYVPLAYVTISNGQTAITEPNIEDARVPWAAFGSGSVAPHAIDGMAHTIGGLTNGYLVKSDGTKVVPATNTDAQVAATVTASHARQHVITSTSDHTSTATPGQMLKADSNGLPINATNTDAQVSSTVSASHARQHSITSTSDHTSTATPGRILKADANGLPVDATNTDAEIAAAVAAAGSIAPPHIHGLARWVSDGGTTFNLPDTAEYVDTVNDAGTDYDPLGYSLSSDRTQIAFDVAPVAGRMILCNYVVGVI